MTAHPARSLVVGLDTSALEALIQRLGLIKPSYSRRQVGEILNISESGVDRLLQSGRLPSFQVGGRVIVARNDLAQFMSEGERGCPPPPEPEPKPQPRRRSRRKARKGAR